MSLVNVCSSIHSNAATARILAADPAGTLLTKICNGDDNQLFRRAATTVNLDLSSIVDTHGGRFEYHSNLNVNMVTY
ncbi:MAG TPA: hypothetical protein VMF86_15830 [Stellaceae bacterium]|nr:hypothetical protein [Stellaceae bacterium]